MLRMLVFLLVAAAALHAAPSRAQTPAWPSRSIRWVVPYSAGGGADALARMIAPGLARELGQAVVIDNKPGAASSIAAVDVAHAPPDGYTMMSADNGTLVYNPSLYRKLPYDPEKDFTMVSLLGRLPTILVAGPASPARDARELIHLIEAQPGRMPYASAGTGSPHAMAMELFKNKTHTSMIHVPYRGGSLSLQDVAAGQVPITMTDYAGGGGMIRGGKVRALAVASSKRLAQLPDVPTFGELGYPEVLADAFGGIVVPAKTPRAVIDRLAAALHTVVTSPEVEAKLIAIGYEPVGGSPEQFERFIQAERARWQPLIRELNISLD